MVRVHGDFTGRMATRSEKNKQGKKPYGRFSNPDNNARIYCSYLITTSEESTEEEQKVGDDSQYNDFIYLSRFELIE